MARHYLNMTSKSIEAGASSVNENDLRKPLTKLQSSQTLSSSVSGQSRLPQTNLTASSINQRPTTASNTSRTTSNASGFQIFTDESTSRSSVVTGCTLSGNE